MLSCGDSGVAEGATDWVTGEEAILGLPGLREGGSGPSVVSVLSWVGPIIQDGLQPGVPEWNSEVLARRVGSLGSEQLYVSPFLLEQVLDFI